MRPYNRVIEVSFKVPGLKGKVSIHRAGRFISASGDCKQFIPDGVQAKHHPSYVELTCPTAAQIAKVFSRIATHEENRS